MFTLCVDQQPWQVSTVNHGHHRYHMGSPCVNSQSLTPSLSYWVSLCQLSIVDTIVIKWTSLCQLSIVDTIVIKWISLCQLSIVDTIVIIWAFLMSTNNRWHHRYHMSFPYVTYQSLTPSLSHEVFVSQLSIVDTIVIIWDVLVSTVNRWPHRYHMFNLDIKGNQ